MAEDITWKKYDLFALRESRFARQSKPGGNAPDETLPRKSSRIYDDYFSCAGGASEGVSGRVSRNLSSPRFTLPW